MGDALDSLLPIYIYIYLYSNHFPQPLGWYASCHEISESRSIKLKDMKEKNFSLYALKFWAWPQADLQTVQMDNLRGLLGIRRIDRIPTLIRELCGVRKGLDERIVEGVLRWLGHLESMERDRRVCW